MAKVRAAPHETIDVTPVGRPDISLGSVHIRGRGQTGGRKQDPPFNPDHKLEA